MKTRLAKKILTRIMFRYDDYDFKAYQPYSIPQQLKAYRTAKVTPTYLYEKQSTGLRKLTLRELDIVLGPLKMEWLTKRAYLQRIMELKKGAKQ